MKKSIKQTKSINATWFTDALSDAEKSQADLARHLDLSPSQVSKLLKGGRRVQLDEVEKIASFLGKTNAEVLVNLGIRLEGGAAGGPQITTNIPVVGHIEADGTANLDIEHPSRTVDAPGRVPPGTVAISANGSMHTASTLLVGGLFFVQMTDRLEPSAIGHLSLVRLAKGPWMLRTIKPAAEVGLYDLVGPTGVMQSQAVIAGSPILLIRP